MTRHLKRLPGSLLGRTSIRLTLACIAASVSITTCDSKSSPVSATSSAPRGTLLWAADHETGSMSQWYTDGGGGEFNSGAASSTASPDVAHSGGYSAKATIVTPGTSGVRLFRWNESRATPEAYYSAWFYFPRSYRIPDWWNIFSELDAYRGLSPTVRRVRWAGDRLAGRGRAVQRESSSDSVPAAERCGQRVVGEQLRRCHHAQPHDHLHRRCGDPRRLVSRKVCLREPGTHRPRPWR